MQHKKEKHSSIICVFTMFIQTNAYCINIRENIFNIIALPCKTFDFGVRGFEINEQ